MENKRLAAEFKKLEMIACGCGSKAAAEKNLIKIESERLSINVQDMAGTKIVHLNFKFKPFECHTLEESWKPSRLEKLEGIFYMNVADKTKQVTQIT